MDHPLLISPAEVEAGRNSMVFDCRFDLQDPEAGRQRYHAGHVPGALYAHLDADLAGLLGPHTGRHPLPDADRFAARLRSWGLANDSQVVVYDDVSGAYAARLWWMLRWLGHDAVALMDGGWSRWQREGRRESVDVPKPPPGSFEAQIRAELVVETPALHAALGSTQYRLLDLRAAERYLGLHEPIDPVAGHVPGAVNLPFTELLDENGNLLAGDELRQRLRPCIAGARPAQLVCMCGSGVTAGLGVAALALAELGEARLYPGSWSEWIRDPQRPVAKGAAR